MAHERARKREFLLYLLMYSNKLAYLQLIRVLVHGSSPPKSHEQSYLNFKGCVRYFLSNFYISPNDSSSKTMKFFIHLKSPFRSRDIQMFVFMSSPLFLSFSHCFRGLSKLNLKVYDIITCLNRNLITHFVWYLGKEKRYDIETLSIDRVLNKKNFYGILLYLPLLYPELPQLQVLMLVLGATFLLFRFPGPCILIFFQFSRWQVFIHKKHQLNQ